MNIPKSIMGAIIYGLALVVVNTNVTLTTTDGERICYHPEWYESAFFSGIICAIFIITAWRKS